MSGDLDIKNIWEKCLKYLEKKIDTVTFETCIKNISPIKFENNVFVLGVTPFALSKIEKNDYYKNFIEMAVQMQIGDLDLSIRFEEMAVETKVVVEEESEDISSDEPIKINGASSFYINPKYKFENFVVGASNELAHSACYAVASNPGKAYNPLFIYGGVGLGKTHLLQAIANTVLSKNPKTNIEYTSAEKFTSEFISHLKESKTEIFRRKYRNVDFLLIDDMQFLQNKKETQNEFFHTFNELHSAGKQIVITSDRPPKEIPNISDRLSSRFESGLKVDIQPPNIETRQAILMKKAEVEKIYVPHDVINFIAENITTNIRELEGALTGVIARASLKNLPIDMNIAKEALKNDISYKERDINIDEIQRCTSKYFGIDVADIKSSKRDQKYSIPRHIAMYLAREKTNMSYLEIARAFNKSDHTTVKHAYEKVLANLKSDSDETKNSINNIIDMIKS